MLSGHIFIMKLSYLCRISEPILTMEVVMICHERNRYRVGGCFPDRFLRRRKERWVPASVRVRGRRLADKRKCWRRLRCVYEVGVWQTRGNVGVGFGACTKSAFGRQEEAAV